MATKKQIPDIDEQWRLWQIENEPERFEHIDTEELRQAIIADLTVKSQMDVREYTLYQKWCEVHEKFPTKEVNTLFGENEIVVSYGHDAGEYIDDALKSMGMKGKRLISSPTSKETPDVDKVSPVKGFRGYE